MNERILKIISEMDRYMPSGTMYDFLYAHRRRIKFNVSLSKKDKEEDIEVLDLGNRSMHCLRRAGFDTVGSLLEAIAVSGDEKSKDKLMKLRNLGLKSADEILLTIMCYQFQKLSDRERTEFLQDVIKLNGGMI